MNTTSNSVTPTDISLFEYSNNESIDTSLPQMEIPEEVVAKVKKNMKDLYLSRRLTT